MKKISTLVEETKRIIIIYYFLHQLTSVFELHIKIKKTINELLLFKSIKELNN